MNVDPGQIRAQLRAVEDAADQVAEAVAAVGRHLDDAEAAEAAAESEAAEAEPEPDDETPTAVEAEPELEPEPDPVDGAA